MTELVANCPRCGAKNTTFDVGAVNRNCGVQSGWCHSFEVFCVCRACRRSSIHLVQQVDLDEGAKAIVYEMAQGNLPKGASLNPTFNAKGSLSLKNEASVRPLEHLPEKIGIAFREGATDVVTKCWNSAGAMFPPVRRSGYEGQAAAERHDRHQQARAWQPRSPAEMDVCQRYAAQRS